MKTKLCDNYKHYKKIYDLYIKNEEHIISTIIFAKYKDTSYEIKKLCSDNWDKIQESIGKMNDIIDELDKNINLKRSLIGDFIKEYKKIQGKIKSPSSFYNYILLLVDRPNFYIELKQLLYILSNNKRCHLLIDNKKYKILNDKYVKDIVKSTSGNIDLMKQYLVRKSLITRWGNPEYEYIREIFEMLKNINKFYKNPLKIFNINAKKNESKNIDDILMKYVFLYKTDDYDESKIITIGDAILFFKYRMTLWEAVDLIFHEMFHECDMSHIENTKIINNNNIEFQRKGILTGFKIFIMVKNGMINNSNLFANFKN